MLELKFVANYSTFASQIKNSYKKKIFKLVKIINYK